MPQFQRRLALLSPKTTNIFTSPCLNRISIILQKEPPGPCLNIKTVLPRYEIPMLKMRRSWDRLIFNMGIPILVRKHLYIETAPWWKKIPVTSPNTSMEWTNELFILRQNTCFPSFSLYILYLRMIDISHKFLIKRMATMNDNLVADIHSRFPEVNTYSEVTDGKTWIHTSLQTTLL